MNDAANPYRSWGMVAADAEVNERAQFIRQTYLHLAGAVVAFMAIEAFLLSLPGVGEVTMSLLGNRFGWLLVLGGFMGVSYIASSWANSATSVSTQYMGLALYVVAEAIIFVPLLYVAENFAPENSHVIATAGVLTLVVFTGLTAVVLLTGADFSFLRTVLALGGFVALGVIICGMIFQFNLGLFFMGAMIALASGYILYDTSNVLHHYRIGQHVAAALALFASVALLFWYILQFVLSVTSRR